MTSESEMFPLAAGAWCQPTRWRCLRGIPSAFGRRSRHQTGHWFCSACPPMTTHPLQTPVPVTFIHTMHLTSTRNPDEQLQRALTNSPLGTLQSQAAAYPLWQHMHEIHDPMWSYISHHAQRRANTNWHYETVACICRYNRTVTWWCRATDLVIRRQFHRRNTVDVFLHFIEEVVPTSNEATLVLIVDQL